MIVGAPVTMIVTVTSRERTAAEYDTYKRSTWPKCPDETALWVSTVSPKVVRLTAAKNPGHGNTKATKFARLGDGFRLKGEVVKRPRYRTEFWLPTRQRALQAKRDIERKFRRHLDGDGFLRMAVPPLIEFIEAYLNGSELERHPFAARNLWITMSRPETVVHWGGYQPR